MTFNDPPFIKTEEDLDKAFQIFSRFVKGIAKELGFQTKLTVKKGNGFEFKLPLDKNCFVSLGLASLAKKTSILYCVECDKKDHSEQLATITAGLPLGEIYTLQELEIALQAKTEDVKKILRTAAFKVSKIQTELAQRYIMREVLRTGKLPAKKPSKKRKD